MRARTFGLTAVVFLTLDAIWLSAAGPRIYRPALGALMRPDFDVVAAIAFYVIYIAGLTRFAILPSSSLREAATQGALFGLVAYATYDLTNQATLIAWRWHLTALDLAWGATASAIACAVAWRFCCRPR